MAHALLPPVAIAVVLLGAYLLQRLYYTRFTQYKDFPQSPARSLIWGHLKWLGQAVRAKDPKYHTDIILTELRAEMNNPPVFLLDLRPVLPYPMLVVADHDVAEQISKPSKLFTYSTPKSPTVAELHPLTGHNSMLTAEGEVWKSQRKRLNTGFAPTHLMKLLPAVLNKTRLFLGHLDKLAESGESFELADYTTNLTFDIIGAVTMNLDFNAQIPGKENETLRLFKAVAHSYQRNNIGGVPLISKYWASYKRDRLADKLEKLIKQEIGRKYEEMQSHDDAARSRSVLGLSLQGVEELTPALVQNTSDNLRVFLFAGHDTTSILLSWTFYELERLPRAKKALREELDRVFGTDADFTAVQKALLAEGGSELLNQLPYTSAVIKESLRLHPPAGSARMAPKGSNAKIVLPGTGQELIVDGLILYVCHAMIQRDKSIYGENANEFVPERWLTSDSDKGEKGGDSKNIPVSAWRPFERGPRSCIGQELANTEAKVIMACAARRYDFTKVGLGEFEVDEKETGVLGEDGYYKTKSFLYNTSQVTSRPADDMVMKVKLSKQAAAA